MSSSRATDLHAQALDASSRYRKAEADLIRILQEIESERVFLTRGHASLFEYVTRELGLGEHAAYTLITIARKVREVPALRERLESGAITLSNARRVVAVLTKANQSEWLEKASSLSNRALEKEIARERPEETVRERAAYVTPDRLRLELGISEEALTRLRRVQDLLSQARRRPVQLEECVEALAKEYLDRHDPVIKAERVLAKEKKPIEKVRSLVTLRARRKREPLPASSLHAVHRRDQGQCTAIRPDGQRCLEKRWIEIHHRHPVAQGGSNSTENLETLCSGHHRMRHSMKTF